MSYGDKVAAHPDREEIIDRLLRGESVRGVSSWLKKKYPSNKNRHISYLTLQRYRQQHLNLKGEVLADIRNEAGRATTTALAERVDDQRSAEIQESPRYQQAKLQIAHDILSREQVILDLQDKIWQRVKLLEQEEINYKTEQVLVTYISELRQLMTDFHKMVVDIEKLQSKNKDHQVNVQVVMQQAESQVNAVKTAVKDVLQEMEPDLIPLFLDKLKHRVEEAEKHQGNNTVNVQVNNYG